MNGLFSPHDRARARAGRQRGAATLIVVMVLFFVLSLVAAYTNRNLVFEQRTSANQLRSTQALEAADAGLQWALGLLNSGRIDNDCQPSANPADTTFRERYLTIDPVSGNITPKLTSGGGDLLPSCVFDGANWSCSCPIDGAPSVTPPVSTAVHPAFRLRFQPNPTRSTLVRIEVNGCTRYHADCLGFPAKGADNEGRAAVSGLLALKGAIATVPVAALTARGAIDVSGGGATMTVHNSNPKTAGITIQSGETINPAGGPELALHSTPGTPGNRSIREGDSTLNGFPPPDEEESMFIGTFGLRSTTYQEQPATVELACPCNAAVVRAAALANPGRILWAPGDVVFDTAGDVGSPAEPIVLVAEGQVTFPAAAVVHGLVYTRAATWNPAGTGEIRGAMVAESAVTGNNGMTIAYDADILTALRVKSGTFVMVPGSWKDF